MDRFRCRVRTLRKRGTHYVERSSDRYERRSVLITTNLVFSAWERIFKDPMTTLAAVDRVVHHAVILDMAEIKSFRATRASASQAEASSEPPASSELTGS